MPDRGPALASQKGGKQKQVSDLAFEKCSQIFSSFKSKRPNLPPGSGEEIWKHASFPLEVAVACAFHGHEMSCCTTTVETEIVLFHPSEELWRAGW